MKNELPQVECTCTCTCTLYVWGCVLGSNSVCVGGGGVNNLSLALF